jgi:hypothetical protein
MCDATAKITRNHDQITETIRLDITIVLIAILLAGTVVASMEYYKQIRKAQKEYEKARDYVQDIVLSFNRELKRETERVDSILFKVDGSASKADASLSVAEGIQHKIGPIEERLYAINQTISQTITQTTQNNTSILSGIAGLDSKIKDIEATQESLRVKLSNVEEQMQKLAVAPPPADIRVEPPLPVIPIKRDKAMAALTDTEIAVLEMLSKEGPKTAPEIKERVQLSREHTARLMKKLYEGGYLEREAGKIPFRYSIKKEMEALLQKAEAPSSS